MIVQQSPRVRRPPSEPPSEPGSQLGSQLVDIESTMSEATLAKIQKDVSDASVGHISPPLSVSVCLCLSLSVSLALTQPPTLSVCMSSVRSWRQNWQCMKQPSLSRTHAKSKFPLQLPLSLSLCLSLSPSLSLSLSSSSSLSLSVCVSHHLKLCHPLLFPISE